MSKVIIFGAGNLGKRLISIFEECREVVIEGIADNAEVALDGRYPILDVKETKNKGFDVIIAMANPMGVVEVYMQLKSLGYKRIFWYNNINVGERRQEYGNVFLIDCTDWGNCILPQVEMHVIDCCNLSCRGCTHFSPIFAYHIPNVNDRLRDIEKLKMLFSHIAVFNILGGEPLLNPQLNQYICKIRELLPKTHIVLVTNGLLIPRIEEELLACIRENQVLVSISEYEPTHKIIDQITERLEAFGITYRLRSFDAKQKFNKPLSLSANSIHKRKCISDGCVNLYEGKISRCPTLMYINHFNEVFHTDLPDVGIIDLYSVHDGNELLDMLQQKVPLCRHCIENEMPWGRCGKDKSVSDFAVDD